MYGMCKVAWYILTHRPLALITDFEAIGAWTALLLRTRVIELDNFCAARLAEPPFQPSEWERRRLKQWSRTLKAVVPTADRYLVMAPVRPPLREVPAEAQEAGPDAAEERGDPERQQGKAEPRDHHDCFILLL